MLERGREKRSLRNVSVTMILYRESEDDKAEKLREKTDRDTIVNVDFPKGTSVASAREQQVQLRQIGNEFVTKFKYAKGLKPFFIGVFDLQIDETDYKWLKDEIAD